MAAAHRNQSLYCGLEFLSPKALLLIHKQATSTATAAAAAFDTTFSDLNGTALPVGLPGCLLIKANDCEGVGAINWMIINIMNLNPGPSK